ncbi:NADH:flavin oxidoreductase [Kribbella sp. NPDC056345]|uniref:oxidoreductase n=1 Tax=Kribbella sp. NPDC056345 TaxID=3345789 RepID=UPI0035DE1135
MTDTVTTTLATTLQLPCGAVLPNRIAKAAMSEQLAQRDGTTTDKLHRLYAVWGRSGAGLLITGNVMIDRDALTEPGNVILDDARDLDGIRAWAGAAKEGGAQVWMQINHPGKVAVAPFDKRPVAPTAIRSTVPGYNIRKPRTLTAGDIDVLIGRFARTAELAMAGGFDGVQIHAAHGYLLSQFLSPLSNHREDAWGGDPERRMRLLLDVVSAVRGTIGSDQPIAVKLNSRDFTHGGFGTGDALEVALALAAAGIDLLEISGGGYEAPAMTGVARGQEDRPHEAYFAEFAEQLRAHTDLPIMLTGGLRTPAHMSTLVSNGTVDVIGLGRPMTFVPNYPARILAGERPTLPRGPRRTGYRPLDGYLELAWHNAQIHRITAGKTPQRHPGAHTIARAATRLTKAAARQATIPR